ncbi:hypothetical protein ACFFV7_18495 [Nonomuraea spiralis]|uniref:Uncharacterized protein n=1 Tax=Nonomuraea spiralis TaxID=46182 RepID=A0ABV5IF81_9ACTN|nr:hypothetical protein [Nonomuraea spiralis]GGS71181.1 hypothetical protein GCM10010176_012580 [Nonomuraea spiralis]
MSLRRHLAAVAGSAVLCLAAAGLAPSPALAAPTGCTAWISGDYAYSTCTSGTGEHSVGVEQSHPLANPILLTGGWTTVGGVSSVRLMPWPVKRIWVNRRG